MTKWASVTGALWNSPFRKIALLVGHASRLERLRDPRLKDTNGQARVPHRHMTGTICMYRLN